MATVNSDALNVLTREQAYEACRIIDDNDDRFPIIQWPESVVCVVCRVS